MDTTEPIPAAMPVQSSISCGITPLSAERPKIRSLTVSTGMRDIGQLHGRSARAPMLRLQGAWLKQAGFEIGDRVAVHVSSGRMVIELINPVRGRQAEALSRTEPVVDTRTTRCEPAVTVRRLKRDQND